MIRHGLLALWLLLVMVPATASQVMIDTTASWPRPLEGKFAVLEDGQHTLTPEDAFSRLSGRQPSQPGAVTHVLPTGLSQSAWWLYTEVVNTASKPLDLIMTPGTTMLKQVDFYLRQSHTWRAQYAGLAVPASGQARPSREPNFEFSVLPGERVQLLLHVQSARDIGLNPKLYAPAAFQAREARAAIWDGALLGGLMALGWSTLLLFAFSRSMPFFWLGALSLNVALFESNIRGYAKVYLWPEAAEWGYRSLPALGISTSVLMIGFLFALARHEQILLPARRLLIAIAGVQSVLTVMCLVGDVALAARLGLYVGILSLATKVFAAAVLVRKRTPTGIAMLLATAFALLNIGLRIAQQQGLAPDFITRLGADISPNPVIALLGLGLNLVVFTSWISLVGKQRRQAREALAAMQQNEQDRLRREVERQTKALNEARLYAEEKNRQKTQTLGYISHDLRAPLATIAGYARLLHAHDDASKQHIHAIERSVGYQLALIDELLEYTKAELQPLEIKAVPTCLPALLEDIASYAATLSATRQNRFTYAPASRLPQAVVIDGRRLQQVLLNLLSNAAKFTQHGDIRLGVQAIEEKDSWLLRFTVQDTGIGIDLGAQSSIFDAFRQLQHAQGGVGLGMYIAQRIVQGMGSELRLSSVAGIGSTFTFEARVPSIGSATTVPAGLTTSAQLLVTPERHLAVPPSHRRLELARLARDGRLTDIECWLESLAQTHPAASTFYQEIRQLVDSLDFERVEALALSPEL